MSNCTQIIQGRVFHGKTIYSNCVYIELDLVNLHLFYYGILTSTTTWTLFPKNIITFFYTHNQNNTQDLNRFCKESPRDSPLRRRRQNSPFPS